MIVDHVTMRVVHGDAAWTPTSKLWLTIAAMSKQINRVWDRDTMLTLTGSSGYDMRTVDSNIKHIRREFKARGWNNPIVTRYGLGYVWVLPVQHRGVETNTTFRMIAS